MRVVKEETGLTSRQIRYYDEVDLIFPERSPGNQRLFSQSDISELKKIKQLLDEGYNISSIKKKLSPPRPVKEDDDHEVVSDKKIDRLRVNSVNRLSSLYPVSNRSYLNKVLGKKNRTK